MLKESKTVGLKYLTIALVQPIKHRLKLFLQDQSLQCMIMLPMSKMSNIGRNLPRILGSMEGILKLPPSQTLLQLPVLDPRCRPKPEVQTAGSQASPCKTSFSFRQNLDYLIFPLCRTTQV